MVQQAFKEHVEAGPEPTSEIKRSSPSVVRLFSELMQETSSLVHNEVTLVRAEVAEKIGQAQSGAVSLLIGAVLGIPALTVLLVAGVFGLARAMEPWQAALIVGSAAAIVAIIFLIVGRNKLKAKHLAPRTTAASLREDRRVMQEHTR